MPRKCCTTSCAARCRCTAPSAVPTRCRWPNVDDRPGDGYGRRSHRGAPGHRRQARCCATTSRSDDMWPTEYRPAQMDAAREKFADYLDSKWGTCERRRNHRPPTAAQPIRPSTPTPSALDGRPGPARCGVRPSSAVHQRWRLQRDLRDPARRPAHGAAQPAADRCPGPQRDHAARIPRHRGARRHRRAAPAGHRRVRRPVGARRTFYIMGFVDGWSPMETTDAGPRLSTPTSTPRKGLAYELVDAIASSRKVDWRRKGLEGLRQARGLPRAPGRPLAGAPRPHQVPRAARPRRGRGVAAQRTAASTSRPASSTATTSSPT